MRGVKSGLFWQFSGGFVLGTLALLAVQPAEARQMLVGHVASALPIHL